MSLLASFFDAITPIRFRYLTVSSWEICTPIRPHMRLVSRENIRGLRFGVICSTVSIKGRPLVESYTTFTPSTARGVVLCIINALINAFNAMCALFRSFAVMSMKTSFVFRSIFEYSEFMMGGKLSTYPRASLITGHVGSDSIRPRYSLRGPCLSSSMRRLPSDSSV